MRTLANQQASRALRIKQKESQPPVRTMDEIDHYVKDSEAKIKGPWKIIEDKATAVFHHAQILVCVGRHSDALDFFADAMQSLSKSKNSSVWKKLYCSVGVKYASALDYVGQYDKVGEVFKEVMSVDPVGDHIGDYALYLHRRKRDFDQAQAFYTKALELYPQLSSIHLKYAGFLRHSKRDIAGAERHYLKAVEASPQNSDALGSYASFMHGVHNNIVEAEKYYKKAVEVDTTHTNNLCNYGLFLSEEKRNYAEAERLYKRALEVQPKHANSLYNYAVMLDTHLKRKEEAEALYRRALAVEPRHAYALYNLAVLLEERYSTELIAQAQATAEVAATMGPNIAAAMEDPDFKAKDLKTREDILALYQKAVEADPKDTTTLADYGRYILVRMENPPKAEGILEAALRLNPDCEISLYNMAVIAHRHKMDYAGAEAMLRKLLKLSPSHSAGTLQLARLLAEVHFNRAVGPPGTPQLEAVMEEVCGLYEKSIASNKESAFVTIEYLKLVERAASNKRKLKTIAIMAAAVDAQAKAAKAAAGTAAAVPATVLEEAKSALESLRSAAKKE